MWYLILINSFLVGLGFVSPAWLPWWPVEQEQKFVPIQGNEFFLTVCWALLFCPGGSLRRQKASSCNRPVLNIFRLWMESLFLPNTHKSIDVICHASFPLLRANVMDVVSRWSNRVCLLTIRTSEVGGVLEPWVNKVEQRSQNYTVWLFN